MLFDSNRSLYYYAIFGFYNWLVIHFCIMLFVIFRSRKIKEKRKREQRQISGESEFMIRLCESPANLVFEKLSFVKNVEDPDERQKGTFKVL